MKINDLFIDSYLNLNILKKPAEKKRIFIKGVHTFDWINFDRIPINEIKPSIIPFITNFMKILRIPQDINNLFQILFKFENMLYYSFPFYRDHFFHLLRVGAIGDLLLKTSFFNKESTILTEIVKIQQKEIRTEISDQKIIQCWWIIALLHDFSFPLIFFESFFFDVLKTYKGSLLSKLFNLKLNKKTKLFLTNPKEYCNIVIKELIDYIRKKFERIIKSQDIKLNFKSYFEIIDRLSNNPECLYKKFSDGKVKIDHGLLSSILFLDLIDIDASTIKEDLIQISMAILIHNVKSLQIDFTKHPFMFFIVLIDEIQEWSRPFVRFYKINEDKSVYDQKVIPLLDFIELNIEIKENYQFNPEVYINASKFQSEDIVITFDFSRKIELLKKINFDLNRFIPDKSEIIKRLKKNKIIPNFKWIIKLDKEIISTLSSDIKEKFLQKKGEFILL